MGAPVVWLYCGGHFTQKNVKKKKTNANSVRLCSQSFVHLIDWSSFIRSWKKRQNERSNKRALESIEIFRKNKRRHFGHNVSARYHCALPRLTNIFWIAIAPGRYASSNSGHSSRISKRFESNCPSRVCMKNDNSWTDGCTMTMFIAGIDFQCDDDRRMMVMAKRHSKCTIRAVRARKKRWKKNGEKEKVPKSACGFSFGSFSLARARNGVHVFVISVFSFFFFSVSFFFDRGPKNHITNPFAN